MTPQTKKLAIGGTITGVAAVILLLLFFHPGATQSTTTTTLTTSVMITTTIYKTATLNGSTTTIYHGCVDCTYSTSTTVNSTTSKTTSSTSTKTSSVFLTVKSNSSHFVDIWSGGVQTSSGLTNTSFAETPGQTFTLGAFDNGCYRFNHWTDGSTQRFLNMSITSNTTLTAVYSNICLPLPAGYSNVTVATVDSSGSVITGYYTTLWQNGALNQSCFSPCSFAVAPGTYQVAVSDFHGLYFNHWTDGTTTRFHTVIVGSGSKVNLTAVDSTVAPASILIMVPIVVIVIASFFAGIVVLPTRHEGVLLK